MNKHYIVLNGKRYDATTGALLGSADTPVTPDKPQHGTSHRTLRDGATLQNIPKSHVATKKPTVSRPQPSHIAPHKPQGGKTLMRRAVKRPVGNDFVSVKRQYPLQPTTVSSVIAPKSPVNTIDPVRLKRAHAIHKSSQIGKFIAQATTPIRPKVAPIRVATAPTQPTALPQHHVKPSTKKQTIFEEALANATSHENTYKAPSAKKHKKAFGVAAGFTAVFVVAIALAVLNRPAIEVQVASLQAGFRATTPSYVPSGYEQNTTAVEGKSVSINYVSPQDSTTYSLTQEPSSWNSQTLLSTIVARTGGTYRVIEHNGRTIYIYDGNKAAWVDGGVLYTIAGGAPLSTDQITSIAASL